jgi:hypothetical protein
MATRRDRDRLLWSSPPWSLGPCLKRSLVLLEVWSRCSIETRLTWVCAARPCERGKVTLAFDARLRRLIWRAGMAVVERFSSSESWTIRPGAG